MNIPPQINSDPSKANADALKTHDPRVGVCARGADTVTKKPMIAYLVDMAWVRDNVWQDATEGGNSQRYPWIPSGEYWIDESNINEADFILAHETAEDMEMRDEKMDYGTAHSTGANEIEYEMRHNPEKRIEILRSLGWQV